METEWVSKCVHWHVYTHMTQAFKVLHTYESHRPLEKPLALGQ